MSRPDMRFAIQYAMTYPDHIEGALPVTDPCAMGSLEFSEPDFGRFPCLELAREAARRGGTMPAVLNAANEVAVGRFLDRKIRFSDIWRCVERVMNSHQVVAHPDLDAVLQADEWSRETAGRED
jgi:1-deoxy-D-xylulose-5-phosphate reductoisomerase